jgi:DNA mismatch repair protein MutS
VSKKSTTQLSFLPPEESAPTPLMRQYYQAKHKYPDALVLFRIGDFYETFGEDAIKASQVLGITLTSRNNGAGNTELAGFPYHSLDVYLPRLVRAGLRVAICEQLEKPIPGQIVKRGVTEVITPGVTTDDKLLDTAKNNYLASIAPGPKEMYGICLLDISTGELLVSEGDSSYLDKIISAFQPAEILFPKPQKADLQDKLGANWYWYGLEDWVFVHDYAREKLLAHFNAASLKGFGVEEMWLAQIAAGAALHYLATTENTNLKHITRVSRLAPDNYVWLDRFTIRNLELLHATHEGGKSLYDIMQRTLTPMGSRLLRKWVLLPLKNQTAIESRHDMVGWWIEHPDESEQLSGLLRQIGDLERLLSKAPMGKINPREVGHLRRSLGTLPEIIELLQNSGLKALQQLADKINPCKALFEALEERLLPELPMGTAKGNMINDGFDAQLDEYRLIVRDVQQLLLKVQQAEIARTNITSLKIGFNNVFGYYIEITNKYRDAKIPEDWVRKQTLTTGERYITPELKTLEEKILAADERILALEQTLFQQTVNLIVGYLDPIQQNADMLASLDCLLAFANLSQDRKYVRPTIDNSLVIDIKDGRHPVIEQQLPLDQAYVPNSVFLDDETQQLLMVTGPNMAGKSALLRQTALIALMAQMGCYVPAMSARIGILDKVFTRVGASDNISSGESTFMVEMNETASIMNNISDRSLILLDEIGRGTSTFDGISIAWSIAEYLHENGQFKPKTLFATHYHELNELAEKFPRVKNYNVSVHEHDGKVVFLRKLQPGGSQHSFGIYVAKLAGMPPKILDRANQILLQLEQQHLSADGPAAETLRQLPDMSQWTITDTGDPIQKRMLSQLEDLDLSILTPIECMMKLLEWQELLKKRS